MWIRTKKKKEKQEELFWSLSPQQQNFSPPITLFQYLPVGALWIRMQECVLTTNNAFWQFIFPNPMLLVWFVGCVYDENEEAEEKVVVVIATTWIRVVCPACLRSIFYCSSRSLARSAFLPFLHSYIASRLLLTYLLTFLTNKNKKSHARGSAAIRYSAADSLSHFTHRRGRRGHRRHDGLLGRLPPQQIQVELTPRLNHRRRCCRSRRSRCWRRCSRVVSVLMMMMMLLMFLIARNRHDFFFGTGLCLYCCVYFSGFCPFFKPPSHSLG